MTNPDSSTGRQRIGALLLAAGMLCVWLLGARAALSSSIYSAKHACCHQQKLADSCRTLCASAHWTATPSVQQAAVAFTTGVVWMEPARLVSVETGIFVNISAVNHSPPLYLQHSSLLI